MSSTEHKRCQRLILIFPFPNSAWAFPELACSLDKFSVELGGWERAETVRWVVQCVQQFSKQHILLWLPCRSRCQRSGELPCREQMPSCAREGLAWSLLSAAIPLQQVFIHFGRGWVQLCVAKTAFQAAPVNQIQAWDWPHVYTIPSVYLTPCSFQHLRSQTGKLWIINILGIRLEILHSALSNSCVTWGSWRRYFSEEVYQVMRGKKKCNFCCFEKPQSWYHRNKWNM